MVDSLIGAIADTVEESSATANTIFLVTADHGGIGKKHGGNSMDELLIPWILKGPGVRENAELKGRIDTFDTAPTIAHIYGLKTPDCWIGKPVLSAFKDSPERRAVTGRGGRGGFGEKAQTKPGFF